MAEDESNGFFGRIRNAFSKKETSPIIDTPSNIKPSEDPLQGLGPEAIKETTQKLQVQYDVLWKQLEAHGLGAEQIRRITVFGPGLSETQAIIQSLQELGTPVSTMKVDVIDGDPRVAKALAQERLASEVSVHTQTFADYLSLPHQQDTDILLITNTGPVTCKPGVGFSPDNVDTLTQLVRPAGLIVTRGEVRELPLYLDGKAELFFVKKVKPTENPLLHSSYGVWQRK